LADRLGTVVPIRSATLPGGVGQPDRQEAIPVAAGISTTTGGLIAFFAQGNVISQARQVVNP
jgi:hypothetical protein